MSAQRLGFSEEPAVAREATDDEVATVAVEAVAAATNARLEAMPPLYEVVDPDALDSLFTQDCTGVVAFDYCGCLVCVHADRRIVVYDPA